MLIFILVNTSALVVASFAVVVACSRNKFSVLGGQGTALTVTEMITVILHKIHCETHSIK